MTSVTEMQSLSDLYSVLFFLVYKCDEKNLVVVQLRAPLAKVMNAKHFNKTYSTVLYCIFHSIELNSLNITSKIPDKLV